MNKTIQIQVPEGKVAEWKVINGVTTLVLVDEVDNRPITERIKTFEDACNELGEENVLVQAYRTAEFNTSGNQNDVSDVVAYLKLRVIAAALNEGWEPQFMKDEYRWYPWFYFYTQEEIDRMDEEEKKKLWLWGGCLGRRFVVRSRFLGLGRRLGGLELVRLGSPCSQVRGTCRVLWQTVH